MRICVSKEWNSLDVNCTFSVRVLYFFFLVLFFFILQLINVVTLLVNNGRTKLILNSSFLSASVHVGLL